MLQSYWDISRGVNTVIWSSYRPLTIGAIFFLILLTLLKTNKIKKHHYIAIYAIFVITLSFTHLPELILFNILLITFTIFFDESSFRLTDATVGVIFGLIASLIINISIYPSITYIFIGLLMLSIVTHRYKQLFRTFIKILIKRYNLYSKHIVPASYVWIFIYLGSLITMVLNKHLFTSEMVGTIFSVPLVMYPIQLGITGFLLLLSITYLSDIQKEHKIFILFGLIIFSFGRIISLYNINIDNLLYNERRFLPYIHMITAIPASALIIKFINTIKHMHEYQHKNFIISILLINFIILFGITSTFLSINFWDLEMDRLNTLGLIVQDEDIEVASFLNTLSPKLMFPLSNKDFRLLSYVSTGLRELNSIPALLNASTPEETLTLLNHPDWTPSYVIISKNNYALFSNQYNKSYLIHQMLNKNKPIFNNSKYLVYEIKGIPPVDNSDAIFVNNYGLAETSFIYDLFSYGNFNYTTAIYQDLDQNASTLILSSDPVDAEFIRNLETTAFQKIIVFNTDGFGLLSNSIFSSEDFEITITSSDSHLHYNNENRVESFDSILLSSKNDAAFIIDNDSDGTIIREYAVGEMNWKIKYWGQGLIGGNTRLNTTFESKVNQNVSKLKINDGNNALWRLTNVFTELQNWKNCEFLTFWFKGNNTGIRLRFDVGDVANNAYYHYNWIDDFSGWEQIRIPRLQMVPLGEKIEWDEIRDVWIWTDVRNTIGNWGIGSLSLRNGSFSDFSIKLNGTSPFQLLTADGEKIIQSNELSEQDIWIIEKINYLDGSGSDTFFEGDIGTIRILHLPYSTQMFVRLKLPLDDIRHTHNGPSRVKLILSKQSEKQQIDRIVSQDETKVLLNKTINIIPFVVSKGDVIKYYGNNVKKIGPFITRFSYENKTIDYYNIYPMLGTIDVINTKDIRDMILNVMTDDFNLYYTNEKWIIVDDIFMFTKGMINGMMNIETEFTTLYPDKKNNEVNISSIEGIQTIENYIYLSFENFTSFQITSDNMTFQNGAGFYSNVSITQSSIVFRGTNPYIIVHYQNGSEVIITANSNWILHTSGNNFLIFKNSKVNITGKSSFSDAYAWHDIMQKFKRSEIRSSPVGDRVSIVGDMSFNIYLSDTYTIVKNLTWNGSVEGIISTQYTWNEYDFFKKSFSIIPWSFALLFILILDQIKIRMELKRLYKLLLKKDNKTTIGVTKCK